MCYVHVHMMLNVKAVCVFHVLMVHLDHDSNKHTLAEHCFGPGGERVSVALRKCWTAHFPVVLAGDIDDGAGHYKKRHQ